ncbi:hypothetical protein BC936DRAFT_149156 [Jimgerdemannia flammicorona]|uniref:Uncharacterized protein n=1 Tax=Jimgerdemannia flammicorona TaxID=994334 RepID=A0A433D1G1_9FUNG|nr:hypothetical protein BC936DRAFT_149156 [Jimgerdemannia flammicorona]
MRALVVAPHHSSGDKPGRPSKDNSTKPPSIKSAHSDLPIKASVGPPRSRTPHAVTPDRLATKSNSHKVASSQTTAGVPSRIPVSGRASLREDRRTVLGPAKATINVRSGKSTTVRKELKLSLPIKKL